MKNHPVKQKSFLANLGGFFAFFYYYLGPISVIAYLYAILRSRWNLPFKDWIILTSLCLLFIYSVTDFGFLEAIQLYRFHWGFLFFYFFFRNKTHLFNVKQLLLVMLTLVFIEGFLVNYVISAESLPNYPDIVESPSHFSDVWQRTYGFGGNSSVTGTLIVVVLSLIEARILLTLIAGGAVLFVGGGSGMIAYLFYMIYRLIQSKKIIIFGFLILLMWLLIVPNIEYLYKMSPGYLIYLIDLKQFQYMQEFSNLNAMDTLLGYSNDPGGDFVWLHFLICHGYIGAMLMFFFIFSHLNKTNLFSVFIIILMTNHYFVLFSLPGQLIAGYLFALQKPKSNIQSVI